MTSSATRRRPPDAPGISFLAGDLPVHLIVLPLQARRNPPLSPVSERPERGIGAAELNRLVVADV